MAMTPQGIAKAVIQVMVSGGKDVEFATERMVDLWQDAFPLIRYLDDAGALDALRSREKEKTAPKSSPTDALRADLTFDEVWGGDIGDDTAYAGLAIELDREGAQNVPQFSIHAHVHEGLTRSQLARTGFKEHGGIVLTLLNPMLEELGADVRIGSHFFFKAQLFKAVEMKPLVKWELLGGHLYTAVNVLA